MYRGVCDGFCSDDVIVYLSLMVDMILVTFIDPSVVKMMSIMCFHMIYESLRWNDATLLDLSETE